ncbi:MAG: OmpA family protein, partial [Crocinitomicaceae bacterium]
TVPGIEAFKGCPDTDGDGIKDDEDACPEVPGPLVNNGCPDTDNDGLFDFIDNCPEVAGPKENNGCPWPDTDQDGTLDKDDDCPNTPGPRENAGCPYTDSDNDGLRDKDDKCPNTPGPIENDGCPEIEEEVQEILKTAFENLEFETGKDIIKVESIPSLTELADVLVKRPEWKLQISGHTDNVGNDQANLVLSKKRAEAVKNFMVSQTVAAERLYVLFFGETMPIASNDTKEGRQKNRRVEMKIIFE